MNRWIIYQKERFNLLQYIPMMLTFSFCAVSYSMHLSNPDSRIAEISIVKYLIAFFLTTTFFFMLLRIADEHKDFEEDSKYRSYRPVQRGLVTLRELRTIGIALILLQIGTAVWLDIRLLGILAIVYVMCYKCSRWFG